MKKARILVVEDQIIVARDVRNRLTRLGYEPVGHTDMAERAIDLAAELRPDLILMDISLAGEMDGITAARRIARAQSIPVVFLTAHEDEMTLESAKLVEPFGYIIKPFQDRELRAAIEMGIYRHQSERRLRESEERFRLLFEHTSDAVIISRPDGTVLAANGEACRVFGCTEEVLRRMGRNGLLDLTDPRLVPALEERSRTGRFKGELIFVRADGSKFVGEVSSVIFHDREGVAHSNTIVRDVTQRRAAEDALRRANEQLSLAQAAAGSGVWDWDIASGRVEWARELFAIFGLDPTSDVASLEKWREVIYPEDRALVEERLARATQEGTRLDDEYRVVFPDGQVHWINALGRAIVDDAGRPVRMTGICIDITERKQAAEAVRQMEDRYRELFNTSPDALFLIGRDDRILDVNEVAVRRYGYSMDEFMTMTPASLAPVDLRDGVGARVSEALRKSTSFEWRHRARDGREFPVEIITRPIVVAGEACTFADVRDITERKEAELALRRSDDQLRLVINAIPALVALVDTDFRYRVVNESYERWFGLPLAEARGRLVREVVGEAAWAVIQPFAERALAGESVEYEREMPYERGGARWVRTTFIPDIDDENGTRGFVVLAIDITASRRAEATLRMQATALEAAGSAVVICEPGGLVAWVNPALVAATGLTLSDLHGHSAWGLMADDTPPETTAAIKRAIADGTVWRGEFSVKGRDGRRAIMEATVAPVRDERGENVHVIALGQDVTGQRRLESQLLRAQRMESVGRLAAGLAHDLNNILLPVMLAPAYLREVIKDPEALEVLHTVEVCVKRGSDIIKQLLTFGRGSEARRVPVCLNQTVAEMVRIIEETFSRSIDVRCELPPGTRMVQANATQLHQVIMNLCFNAREAMVGIGRLLLRVEEATLTDEDAAALPDAVPGRFFVLSVSDTGRGIPPEHLDKIFEPFFTTKGIGEGSGLGLSTAMGIVRSHHGFIQVRSEPGRGTEMRVHLPALESV